MQKAMKKFVAVVLTVAMIFSITATAFAAPTPTPAPITPGGQIGATAQSTRNPQTPVTLRVHHWDTEFTDPPGMFPGANATPNPLPPGANTVSGATWRAQRLLPPANWDGGSVADPGLPSAVINYIVNGIGALPSGWSTNSAVAYGVETTPFNPGAGPTPIPTHGSGIYYFSATALRAAVDGISGAVYDGSQGVAGTYTGPGTGPGRAQGLWIVWEVYVAGGPHTGNQDATIHEAFAVNMPTFVHFPTPGNQMQPTPMPTPIPAPGVWVYDLNVYPKPPVPPIVEKDYVGSHPAVDVDGEHTILNWQARFGITNALIAYNDATPPVLIRTGHGLAYPVNNPTPTLATELGNNLPNSLTGFSGAGTAPRSSPVHGTIDQNSFAVIRDILDFRTRLVGVPVNHSGVVTTIDPSFTITFDHAIPTAGVTEIPRVGTAAPFVGETLWVLTVHTFTPTALVPTVTLPDGTVVTYDPAKTAAGVASQGVQVFWVHFTSRGLDFIAATGEVFDPDQNVPPTAGHVYRGFVRVNFSVRAELVYTDNYGANPTPGEVGQLIQLGPINNDFTFNFGRDPAVDVGDIPTNVPTSDQLGIRVNKVNPQGQNLDGAVFYLFAEHQMNPERTGPRLVTSADVTAGLNNGLLPGPGVYHRPIRRAVTGAYPALQADGVTPLTTFVAPVPAYDPGGGLNAAHLVNTAQTTGEALLTGLPPGTYYLVEHQAPPGGYRRILTPMQIVLGIATGISETSTNYVVTFDMTNTRDFELPLTGGAGTIMFTAAGVSLMGGAGLFLFLGRKKEKGQK